MPPHLSQVPFPVQFRASNRCLFGVRGPPARLRSSDERPPMPVHSGQLNRNALRQGCPQNGRFQLCPVGRGHNHAPHKVARVDRARRSPSQSRRRAVEEPQSTLPPVDPRCRPGCGGLLRGWRSLRVLQPTHRDSGVGAPRSRGRPRHDGPYQQVPFRASNRSA